jgi:transcription initiation factor IIF auxiliary subunit
MYLSTNISQRFPVVTKPPYEITETGWGEFEIIVKIFFIDPNERPVSTRTHARTRVVL